MTKTHTKRKDAAAKESAPADSAAPSGARSAPAKKGRRPQREQSPDKPDTVQIGEKWFVVFD